MNFPSLAKGLGGVRTLCSGLLLIVLLSGCALFVSKDNVPLPGKREHIDLYTYAPTVKYPDSTPEEKIVLSPPAINTQWSHVNKNVAHSGGHFASGDNLSLGWTAKYGPGVPVQSGTGLANTPVVANDVLYIMDTWINVSALSTKDGQLLWRKSLVPEDKKSGSNLSGGLAIQGDTIFATTGYGAVHALDARTGTQRWVHRTTVPIRAAPTVLDGVVHVVALDNRLILLSADDGKVLFSKADITVPVSLVGAAGVALNKNSIIVPYTSGNLAAFDRTHRILVWRVPLGERGNTQDIFSITQIRANPIIHKRQIIASSNSGVLAMIDGATGKIQWEQPLAVITTPAVNSDFLFTITTDNVLMAIALSDGKIMWGKDLSASSQTPGARWMGPLLVNDRLVVLSTQGDMVFHSPYTGKPVQTIKILAKTSVAPIVVDQVIYVVGNNGTLYTVR